MKSEALDPQAYAEYRRGTETHALARALGRAAFVLFAINTGFVLVDYIIYPEKFFEFLPTRIGLNFVLGVIHLRTRATHPVASAYGVCWAGAWMLLTVIRGTGGVASDYYVGLVLLLIGIGVLAPLSPRQAALAIGSIFACYVALVLTADATASWHQASLSLFFLSAAAFVGIMSCVYLDRMRFADFLQRREIEIARDQLQQLDIAKSRFTANVHHELRTPLTLTLAPVEAMLAGQFGELSEMQRSYLQTIQRNALRLLKLINNLLDLAKIEGEQLRIRRRAVNPGEIVSEIVAGAMPMAERKGVVIACRGVETLPTINADPDALEKIVTNLLGNALKFTDPGGRIEIEGREDRGGAHLVVSDTGIGIPPDQLQRIFDRFAQVDTGATRRFGGTGIGLALVKELVELHGGQVFAKSDGEGTGTQMHVVLPPGECDLQAADFHDETLLLVEKGASASTSRAATMEAELEFETEGIASVSSLSVGEHHRAGQIGEGSTELVTPASVAVGVAPDAPEVLVVEDNPDMRRLLAFLIGQEFRVRTARNGREGLAALRERAPDIVLTDVMMPEMSGVELCAAIKADPALAAIPVVLVTSKAEREMKIEGLERGADDYVTKPFHPRELLARVRSLVRLRGLQAELGVRNALLESTNVELRNTLEDLREAGAQLVQAERLAAVGELAAGIAHEVNNPVNFALNSMKALRGYVEDVRRVASEYASLSGESPGALSEKLRDLDALRAELGFDENVEALVELGEIVTEGLERTSRLVGDLRDFAAPGDRRSAEVDVARSLRSTLQLVRHLYAQAGVTLEHSIDPDLGRVEGDARALNQVFLNLLKNAAEAFEGGRGQVQVSARMQGGAIVVEVRDNGPGIEPEVQARLFEPFFTTKPAGRGTGLGLSISRRIVHEHGGQIDLESAPGQGTCFRVSLPLRGAEPGGLEGQGQGDAAQA